MDSLDVQLTRRNSHFVDGTWLSPLDGNEPIPVTDSSSGEPFGAAPNGTLADVTEAMAAARTAFPGWSRVPPVERAEALEALRNALQERQDDTSRLISLEVGTPAKISHRIQVGLPLLTLQGFADAARALDWDYDVGNSRVFRDPAGVVATITPWNYPLHQIVAKIGGALAAGCTVVAKPAELAPLSAFVLADAVESVGFPPGVVNIVGGTGTAVGEPLASAPEIDVLSFTGSTRIGTHVAELAARNVTRTALELGGKSASILLDDADLPRAVKTSVGNACLNSGQTCNAWTRLIVPRRRQDEVVDLAIRAIDRLTLGHPLDEATRLGPLVSAEQQASVRQHIEAGSQHGTVVTGRADQPDGLPAGFYVKPTIFADVDPSSPLAQEEIFGPVLAIIPHDGDDHAVHIANDSHYGLAGAVWSEDDHRAFTVARRIRTGQVDVNGAAFNPAAPFGGLKRSGYGREFGKAGIEEFTVLQSLQM